MGLNSLGFLTLALLLTDIAHSSATSLCKTLSILSCVDLLMSFSSVIHVDNMSFTHREGAQRAVYADLVEYKIFLRTAQRYSTLSSHTHSWTVTKSENIVENTSDSAQAPWELYDPSDAPIDKEEEISLWANFTKATIEIMLHGVEEKEALWHYISDWVGGVLLPLAHLPSELIPIIRSQLLRQTPLTLFFLLPLN